MPASFLHHSGPPVPAPSQQGAGTAEFAIVALPILFLGLGGIEISHWLFTRQAVSLALLEAGRTAITHHNRADDIITAFEHALRPLYVSATDHATNRRLERALAERRQRMGAAPWQIEILSPSASAFTDFADRELLVPGTTGQLAINNNYLAEQDLRLRSMGWAHGRGPSSGQTIYEANTAVLRLSWLHQPHLPLIVPVLKALGNSQGTYRQRALAQGYLPMTRQVALMMQSHPVQWVNSPDGKVIYGTESETTANGCTGWLCGTSWSGPALDPPLPPHLDDGNRPALPGASDETPHHQGEPSGADPSNEGNDPGMVQDPADPACGITLCCAPH